MTKQIQSFSTKRIRFLCKNLFWTHIKPHPTITSTSAKSSTPLSSPLISPPPISFNRGIIPTHNRLFKQPSLCRASSSILQKTKRRGKPTKTKERKLYSSPLTSSLLSLFLSLSLYIYIWYRRIREPRRDHCLFLLSFDKVIRNVERLAACLQLVEKLGDDKTGSRISNRRRGRLSRSRN